MCRRAFYTVLGSSKVSDKQKETAALKIKAATGGRLIWAWKIVCPAAAFFFSAAGQITDMLIQIQKERADNPRSIATGYRLCVCASGSVITVVCNSFTVISVSCLHFGQNSGKFLSSVSSLIFSLVLFLQTGQNIHSKTIIILLLCLSFFATRFL